jgi:hypothetical protein
VRRGEHLDREWRLKFVAGLYDRRKEKEFVEVGEWAS